MDFSVAGGMGIVLGPWADPFMWAALAALFVGLAAGLVLRALRRSRRRGDADRRRRSARFARAIVYISFGILALAALFVLADKDGLVRIWAEERLILLAWCALVLILGICAGRNPLVLGLPIACLAFAALAFLRMAIAGWLPVQPGSGSSLVIARLLPYEVGTTAFRGQLELPERDSVPVVQELGFASNSVGIRVESLELKEPLRLAACLVSPKVRAASAIYMETLRLYRVVGLAGPGKPSLGLDFRGPAYLRFLDAVLPLPPAEGFEPGSSPARGSGFFDLAERTRRTSSCASLSPLEPLSFELALSDLSVTLRLGR
jgi:hypothetical protein